MIPFHNGHSAYVWNCLDRNLDIFFERMTEIPSGAQGRFLLKFPQIPEGSKIIGLIFKCRDYPPSRILETFDFREAADGTRTEATTVKEISVSNNKKYDAIRETAMTASTYFGTSSKGSPNTLNPFEVEFATSLRCWVYPFCFVPPKPSECFLINASGFKCETCEHKILDESRAKRIHLIYEAKMLEKMRKHYEFLKTKLWKSEIRLKILEYDNFKCLICGEKMDVKTGHVHHIVDFSADEDLSPANLVTLCNSCHSKLHPVFPHGMWALGWPNLENVKKELRSFYEKVREASMKYKDRFKAPLEHLMLHLCLICPYLESCDIGRYTLNDITNRMKMFLNIFTKRCRVIDLREGLKHVLVEGLITEISEPKTVETKFGLKRLSIAKLKDDTGEIQFNLWEDQIGKVKVGNKVRIEEGYVVTYDGRLTLNVPKNIPLIVNPSDIISIPYWNPSKNLKGKIITTKCSICGKEFSYTYLGGRPKRYCEQCRSKTEKCELPFHQ
jgi:5-methylcytosine-specific restriction endonuclease McrA